MTVVQVNIDDVISNLDFKILRAYVIRGARRSGELRYKLPADMRHSVNSVIFPGLGRDDELCAADMDKVLKIVADIGIAKKIYTPKHKNQGTYSTYVYEIMDKL